jgi:hypothetical protein
MLKGAGAKHADEVIFSPLMLQFLETLLLFLFTTAMKDIPVQKMRGSVECRG